MCHIHQIIEYIKLTKIIQYITFLIVYSSWLYSNSHHTPRGVSLYSLKNFKRGIQQLLVYLVNIHMLYEWSVLDIYLREDNLCYIIIYWSGYIFLNLKITYGVLKVLNEHYFKKIMLFRNILVEPRQICWKQDFFKSPLSMCFT